MLASSDRISSWTPLKPQHSNPNPSPLANQLWCTDFLTPPTLLIIPHRLPAFLKSLMPLKNWCSIHARWSKSSLKHSNCCCSCSFEAEIIKIGQSSHKIYSNNILNFQESTTILNASTKMSGNLLNAPGRLLRFKRKKIVHGSVNILSIWLSKYKKIIDRKYMKTLKIYRFHQNAGIINIPKYT